MSLSANVGAINTDPRVDIKAISIDFIINGRISNGFLHRHRLRMTFEGYKRITSIETKSMTAAPPDGLIITPTGSTTGASLNHQQ